MQDIRIPLLISSLVIWVSCCTLFPKDEKLLKTYHFSQHSFEVYYVGLGATTNDVINIKELRGDERRFIKAIEGYNHVMDLRITAPKTLEIILTDTSYFSNKPDTIRVNFD